MLPLILTDNLPRTKTHKSRGYTFVADATGEHLGKLNITQGRESDTYLVDQVHQQDPALTVLLLAHVTEPSEYEVAILPNGQAHCSGMYCGKHSSCKHRDAVKAVLAEIESRLVDAEEPQDQPFDMDAYAQELDAYFV